MRVVKASPTTSATLMIDANKFRRGLTLVNNGTQAVYVGTDSTVTTATGFPIEPGAGIEDEGSTEALYGVVATGTGDVRIVEL